MMSHGYPRACGHVEIHNPDFHMPTTYGLQTGVLDFEGRFIEAKRALGEGWRGRPGLEPAVSGVTGVR